ncbi:hypothetical protein FRC12_012290 [Ceratobasidium sp. 428]|nr:hypothetical protein FRC12_012290 [Ceratobasidium sp. 428]
MDSTVIPSVPLNSDAAVFTSFEAAPTQRAPLPSANPTKSFWLDSDPSANPLARAGSTGSLPDAADIVIIGSGITGCSAAYHLADLLRRSEGQVQSVSAVILEARDFCSGATGRNGGHLTAASVHDFQDRVKLHGTEEALRDVELERHTVSSILEFLEKTPNAAQEVDLVKGGHVSLLFSPQEVEAARADIAEATRAGLDLTGVELLEPDVTEQRFRVRLPAVFSPGNTIWPLKLVTKLFENAKGTKPPDSWFGRATSIFSRPASGFSLDLFTQAPVEAVKPVASNGAYRWSVNTGRGSIQTRYVIHATNAYASHLLPHLAGPANGIVPTRAQCVTTRGSVKAKSWPTVGWGANEGYEYWFSRPFKSEEERALVVLGGGRETALPHHEFNVADDSTVHPGVSRTLRGFLPTLFPSDFEVAEPEMEWTGIMGFTRTRDPLVGQVYGDDGNAFPGQYIAAGYSGHGMPRAFACAEVVAQMIVADMLGNSWSPPEWFPRHLLTK